MSGYVPNPDDATQPTDAVIAETAAAEFRALKGKMNTFSSSAVLGGGIQNMLINGDFIIEQDHGANNLPAFAGGYIADEWRLEKGTTPNPFDIHLIVNDPINNPPGYISHFDFTVSTTYNPTLPGDFIQLCSAVENLQFFNLDMGTPGAQTSTVLFWAKSTVVGNYSMTLRNMPGDTRSYVHSFNIAVANQWKRYAVVIPGDTLNGSWPITSQFDPGCELCFVFASGTTYRTSVVDAWQAGNFIFHTGDVQFSNQVVGSKFSIGGVEWKAGVWLVTSPPERVPYSVQFLRCARYFTISGFTIPVAPIFATYSFPTIMRTTPTVTCTVPGFVNIGLTPYMSQFALTSGVNTLGVVSFSARML